MTKQQDKKNALSFESQLEQLESIVEGLEGGELTLEDSLTEFEKGVKLTKQCQLILNKAEQKVSILTDGELQDANYDVS